MRKLAAGVILGLIGIHPGGVMAASPLCAPGERVMFSCHLSDSKKIVSLCASPKLSPSSGYIQYRFGTSKSAELVYPAQQTLAKGAFELFHIQSIRSSAYGISFKHEGYEYSLEYLATGPDPADDVYQLLVYKTSAGPDDAPAFEDECVDAAISGKATFYPLETLSKRSGISISESSDDGN